MEKDKKGERERELNNIENDSYIDLQFDPN